MFNPDYKDLLRLFTEHGVEYVVVGAYAMAAHGVVRATGDIDLFVRPTVDNASAVFDALVEFGAPLDGITADDLSVPFLNLESLKRNKASTGRAKDLLDLELLKETDSPES